MLSNMRIGSRLVMMIVIQALILLTIGATALFGLNFATDTTDLLNRNVAEGTKLSYLSDTIRGDLLSTVHRVNTGAMTWADGRERLSQAKQQFQQDWARYNEELTADESEFVSDTLEPGVASLNEAFLELERLFGSEDRTNLALYVLNDLDSEVDPFLNALLASTSERQLTSQQTFEQALQENQRFLYVSMVVIIVGVVLASILGILIYRSISQPIETISDTVQRVSNGDYQVRTELVGADELSELGRAFDGLLQDRVASLAQVERDNEQLNQSVLDLLDAVARMSDRDLTVSVPVAADVTGPVADAINHMVEETSEVLRQVSQIAHDVESAANTVNSKANAVNQTAESQQQEIERTAAELERASLRLVEISRLAARCNEAAEHASHTTQNAMQTVSNSLRGMNDIRDAIQETGKRMKRLGERSNEITGIVDIINTIAERTHVLALNASMQAAAAGDAGRGFAVVAEEVQRLAENARESTSQISDLVRNIQVDTNDTISTMDRTIAQVVEGTRLAEAAGQQMAENQKTTAELVDAVRQIAASSQEQAKISTDLRERAQTVVERTRATAQELVEQLRQTTNLVGYAKNLLSSVQVFKLPG